MNSQFRIAMTIIGPHDPDGIYKDDQNKLWELREHKWKKLISSHQRAEALAAANAVMDALCRGLE